VANQAVREALLVLREHLLRLLCRRGADLPGGLVGPNGTPRALAAANPDFTRSLIRSRSNSARSAPHQGAGAKAVVSMQQKRTFCTRHMPHAGHMCLLECVQ
jgi:hypothetical protein